MVTPALSFRPRQPRLWCRAGRALLRRAWLSCWVSWVSACPATAHASSHCTTSPQITSLDEMDGEHTDFSFFFWEIRLLNVDSSKFVFVVKKPLNLTVIYTLSSFVRFRDVDEFCFQALLLAQNSQ